MREEAYVVRIVGRTSGLATEGRSQVVEAKTCVLASDPIKALGTAMGMIPGVVEIFSASLEKMIVVDNDVGMEVEN